MKACITVWFSNQKIILPQCIQTVQYHAEILWHSTFSFGCVLRYKTVRTRVHTQIMCDVSPKHHTHLLSFVGEHAIIKRIVIIVPHPSRNCERIVIFLRHSVKTSSLWLNSLYYCNTKNRNLGAPPSQRAPMHVSLRLVWHETNPTSILLQLSRDVCSCCDVDIFGGAVHWGLLHMCMAWIWPWCTRNSNAFPTRVAGAGARKFLVVTVAPGQVQQKWALHWRSRG